MPFWVILILGFLLFDFKKFSFDIFFEFFLSLVLTSFSVFNSVIIFFFILLSLVINPKPFLLFSIRFLPFIFFRFISFIWLSIFGFLFLPAISFCPLDFFSIDGLNSLLKTFLFIIIFSFLFPAYFLSFFILLSLNLIFSFSISLLIISAFSELLLLFLYFPGLKIFWTDSSGDAIIFISSWILLSFFIVEIVSNTFLCSIISSHE